MQEWLIDPTVLTRNYLMSNDYECDPSQSIVSPDN